MKTNRFYKRIAASLLAAIIFTAAFGLGFMSAADSRLCDSLYLSEEASDGEIVIIGMDQRALDLLGPMPWPRRVMAEVINYLNSDPENAPAVIGVDVLYVGESSDPEGDALLAEAAELGGNVVVGAAASFGSSLDVSGGGFSMNERTVLAFDKPYDALEEWAWWGHINIMPDTDGIIRHALLYIDVPGEGFVDSMPFVIYQNYCDYYSLGINTPPTNREGFWYLPYTSTPPYIT